MVHSNSPSLIQEGILCTASPSPHKKISLPYFVLGEGRMEAEPARKNGFALGEGAIHDNE